MPNATISISGSIGGIAFQGTVTRAAEGQQSHEVTLAAGKTGTLSTRSSDTAGTLTMTAGHGITDGLVIDIYWTDANGDVQAAYGATVGTVSTNSVPFTGAAGTALPAQTTAIVACVVTEINADFDGDDMQAIIVASNRNAHVKFIDSGAAVLKAQVLRATSGTAEPCYWVDGQWITRPITGNPVDKIVVSNGDSTNTATLKVGVLYDTVT